LTYFTSKENVDYTHQNKMILATKQVKFEKVPPFMIFQLKRFTADNRKILKNILFPLKFNLQPHWVVQNFDLRCDFQLWSVISHYGSETKDGHYINYSFNSVDNCWFSLNDGIVAKTDLRKVISANAYILIYRKCG